MSGAVLRLRDDAGLAAGTGVNALPAGPFVDLAVVELAAAELAGRA